MNQEEEKTDPFIMTPLWLARNPEHFQTLGSAFPLYMYLRGFRDHETLIIKRKVGSLARCMRCDEKTIRRGLMKLRENGYIFIQQMQYGLKIVVPDDEPKPMNQSGQKCPT